MEPRELEVRNLTRGQMINKHSLSTKQGCQVRTYKYGIVVNLGSNVLQNSSYTHGVALLVTYAY